MKKSRLALISLLIVMCMLFSVGCDIIKSPDNTPETQDVQDTDSDSIENESEEDTTDIEPVKKNEMSEEASASLNSFRQSMIGTSQMFGSAFLGYVENVEKADFGEWISKNLSVISGDLSFIPEIPEENIIGGTMGDVYCIVPLDENAKLEINGALEGEDGSLNYKNRLYSGKKGSPVILICNGAGFSPDAEVIITNNSGNSVTWYPNLADISKVDFENGTCSEILVKDFSPYSELLWREYSEMKDGFWRLPTAEQLVGTSWSGEQYLDNGDVHWFEITFRKGDAFVRWDNDGEEHEYDGASWELTYDEGVALIEFDFGGFAGDQICAVLITTEENLLYTCANVVAGETELCLSGTGARTLERIYG